VDRAFKAVFLNRTSWNGIIYDSRPIGGLNQASQYAVDCRFTPQTLEKVIRSYHTLLSGRTSVTCCDAVDFVRDSALPFYADPPYLLAGKNKLYGVQMTEQEHRALAAFVKKQPKWFLTYDCKDAILDGLYWGGHRDSPSVRYSMSTGRLKKWEQRSEVVVWQGFKVKLEA
jgi:DNA adenine methylase